MGELLLGCGRSPDPKAEFARVQKILLNNTFVGTNMGTCVYYARLGAALGKQGVPIPQNDLWIAAICVQCNLPLVSSDEHFSRPAGLKWIAY
jgi:tRNA(fMet)-specific endonuclease VapC